MLARLQDNRRRVPAGREFWQRFTSALQACDGQLGDRSNPLRIRALSSLPGYTGFSEPMIRSTLGAMQLMSAESFPAVFESSPCTGCISGWQPLSGLPGRIRFYPKSRTWKGLSHFPFFTDQPLFGALQPPEMVLGFGAGNVPGNALLLTILSLACTLVGAPAPVTLVRNSRQEPIFAPIVLEAIEQADPDLLSSTAVLVWDYEDTQLQQYLLNQADLVIAAAGDQTISHIQRQIQTQQRRPMARFHPHGHKASFALIGREMLSPGLIDPASGREVLDIVSLLAALDSIFWDQFGCLSARIHFVEAAGNDAGSGMEYARLLAQQLRLLGGYLPRGAWPRQAIHDRFDRYKQLESTGNVRVFSEFDDEFLLVYDQREVQPDSFINQVNECQGRIVIVRPVSDIAEIHARYLRWIPATQLQSLSVATGRPGEGLDDRFLRFAAACGQRGVTAIRTVGRGAFPQLAYSWDGLLPLDLVRTRIDGHFSTIEFDRPYDQIMDTYQLLQQSWLS